MYTFISLLVGVIIGQETDLPRMKPIVMNLIVMVREAIMNSSTDKVAEQVTKNYMKRFVEWFISKKD